MRYPKGLQNNGTIGFVAPSFGCATSPYREAFEHGIQTLMDMGYHISLGSNCYAAEGIGISNTPELCAREFMDSYEAKDSDVLVSCGGGELMCEILPFLDFNRIRELPPKLFMGYSDNTNLTYLLTTVCDVAAIYGPCAGTFGMEPWHPSIRDAYDLLCMKRLNFQGYDAYEKESLKSPENPLATIHATEPSKPVLVWKKDKVTMQGRLIGGCMDCLVNLLGTEFDHTSEFLERYKEDGFIWFLEACDLNVFGIRRAIWQMKHSGWFRYVKGFLFGRPLCMGQEMMGLDTMNAAGSLLEEYQVPIILDCDLGHIAPMMPVLSGSIGTVQFQDNHVSIAYEMK